MSTISVLVVEDDGIIAMSIEAMLSERGYDCRIVTSGEEAVTFVTAFEPDIVLMDIGLSGVLDGITAARIIRKNYPGLPIIYITREDDETLFEQARETRPRHYLVKPFTNEALHRAIILVLQDMRSGGSHLSGSTLGEIVADGVFLKAKDNTYNKVFFSDILYLKAAGSYTHVHYLPAMEIKPRLYVISMSSNHVAEQLQCPAIVKVHKSYYVNIQRIERLLQESVDVAGISIPVSKDYKDDLQGRVRKISKK